MSKKYLLYGISKGLGRAIAQGIPQETDVVYGVSRSKPVDLAPNTTWIQADLSQPTQAVAAVRKVIADQPLDYLIYNVGIWEQEAFEDTYDFEQSSETEIIQIIQTNVTACLLSLQAFIPHLKQSPNAKIILIGSTWGLENHKGREVAFSASKFALRGMVHALRESLREHSIGISVLNLGYLATEYDHRVAVEDVIAQTDGALIPLEDVLAAIRFVLQTSRATCVKEINMPAMKDFNV
ncbi:SDR family oxidoreductase [Myroides sp. DF42-4-2]|uniref:SDR family NAD(P)-dependent oxidoreductase n=1 Tax=unclassified Myroides TaxID=2642485 RepID=UPI0025749610|nr:SDR family oxidoreductase [Myroides sp. DF42-4-2]MDM1406779.1 SDR family oxidoreductase [Myroides sp. DF42-4-2]